MALGKLKKIDPREVWKHEAHDFTTWLAQEPNLKELGDEIGYSLVLVGTEACVGNFNCDILAEVEGANKKVIIENQLEITDHDHLGKLLTYASGHTANLAVWVVRDVREEHRKAIDWLNEHTDEDVEFYLLKIEVLQIGNSECAPRFEVVCKPNDWARSVKDSSSQLALSDTNRDQLAFWTQLKVFATENDYPIKLQKASPQHWMQSSVGSSEACISLTINSIKGLLGTELYIYANKDLYNAILSYKGEIEVQVGHPLEWMELPGKKASRVKTSINCDFSAKTKWPQYFKLLLDEAVKFQQTFPTYIKNFENLSGTEAGEI